MTIGNFLDPLFLINTLGAVGVLAIVFAESGLFFGFFLPGDSLLFTAGFLASQGRLINIYLLIAGVFVAAVAGDSVGYAFGRKVGPKIFSRDDSRFFKKRYLEDTKKFFEKYGRKSVILARFVPIVRTYTPIFAGVGQMSYRIFFTYNVLGGFLWSVFLTGAGYFLGEFIPNADLYVLPTVLFIVFISILPPIFEFYRARRERAGS
jgi:membrane-associated protein